MKQTIISIIFLLFFTAKSYSIDTTKNNGKSVSTVEYSLTTLITDIKKIIITLSLAPTRNNSFEDKVNEIKTTLKALSLVNKSFLSLFKEPYTTWHFLCSLSEKLNCNTVQLARWIGNSLITSAVKQIAEQDMELKTYLQFTMYQQMLRPHISIHRKLITIQFLLNVGFDINKPNNEGNTPLHSAILYSNLEFEDISLVIEYLVKNGAQIGVHNHTGQTALMLLLSGELRLTSTVKIIEIFLKNKADVNAINNGTTPLLQTISNNRPSYNSNVLKIIEILLKHGAIIDAQDNNGETILMKAAIQHAYDIIKFLVLKKANKLLTDTQGLTALDHAKIFQTRDPKDPHIKKTVKLLEPDNSFSVKNLITRLKKL